MPLPVVSECMACPACGATAHLELVGDLAIDARTPVDVVCRCGERWAHPDPTFAREVAHGRERIVVGAAR